MEFCLPSAEGVLRNLVVREKGCHSFQKVLFPGNFIGSAAIFFGDGDFVVVDGIVIGTGDLSELCLGWCTYNGDHMSMYGVNGSVPKSLIRWIVEAVADMPAFAPAKETLMDVLDTPISPELLPPDAQGKISQQTEDIVGPYALHDFFLFYMVRYGFTPTKIYTLACRAFKDDFDAATVKKWLTTFYKRFFSQQFKRNCMPDGVKIGSVGLGPRGDWRMPSDATGKVWLKEIENL